MWEMRKDLCSVRLLRKTEVEGSRVLGVGSQVWGFPLLCFFFFKHWLKIQQLEKLLSLVSKKIKSCKVLVPTSLWHLPLRFLPYFCLDWFCFGLYCNTCFLPTWNRLYWWEIMISVDFLYQNLNDIFYSHIKEPSGLVCLKSLCGVFVLFCLEQSLCDIWLLMEEKVGSTSRCEMLHCGVSTGSAEPAVGFLATEGLVVAASTTYPCTTRCH